MSRFKLQDFHQIKPADTQPLSTPIKYHLRIRFVSDFNDNFLLKLVAKGIASQQHLPDVRLPITMDILVKMLHTLPMVHVNPHEVCMYRAVLVVGFYSLMRPRELTES